MQTKYNRKAPTGQVSDNRRAALTLAAEGWHVIPLGPNKRPLVKGWQDKATDDARQIGRWWAKWPDAMPGLPSGERNGFTVLDIDQKNGKDGFAELKALGLNVDAMSPCQVETASGGRHIYFRWDGQGNSAAGLPAGLDVRGEGGFVVAPGAINGKGIYTGCLTRELPAWPEALPIHKRPSEPGQGEPTGLPFHVIRAALMACPNDGDAYASRDAWLHMVMAVHCETGGSEEGREAVHEWSKQHHGYDPDHTDAAWDSCKADRGLTGWHVVREAEKHGWRDDAVTELRHVELLEDFDGLDPEEEAELDALVGTPPKALTQVEWGTPMMRGDRPVINLYNTTVYLGRNLDSILPGLAKNLMSGRDEWRDGQLNDAAVSVARMALERRGLETVGKEMVADAAHAVARKCAYHPIRDQLNALAWDGTERLDSWLLRHAGAEDSPYVRTVGRKFLIAMVARVMKPGCKQDHTLVLSGRQGQNKSTACRVLAGAEYFSDTLPSIRGDKTDAIRHLQGKWLVELAELAPSRKSESEDLKAFLSGAVDRVRLPYAKFDEAFPRQCVFVGTTNEDQFLRDATGGRRFWPVTVTRVIDVEALAAERDQLFAEAVAAFKAVEPWWLDREFEAEHAAPIQAAAYVSDSWAEDVSRWLDGTVDDFDGETAPREEVTVSEVLSGALGILPGRHTQGDQMRAGNVLKELGWTKHHTRRGNIWRRPM